MAGRSIRNVSPVILTAAMFGAGIAVVGLLWWIGHPGLIDRGEGQPRDLWDWHSPWHLGGSAAIAFVAATVAGRRAGIAVSFFLWTALEIAQWLPRDRQGGYFEWADVLWNAVGAVGGGWLGSLI